MNTTKSAATFAGLGVAVLLVLGVAGCASSGGKPRVRVYEENKSIQLRYVADTAAPLNLKKGDATAMVCSKCKTVSYQGFTSSSRSFWYPRRGVGSFGYDDWENQRRTFQDWELRHYCPGCKSTITVTGSWLNGKETVKHTCGVCGDDSVFCCATPGSAPSTDGMESKSKP